MAASFQNFYERKIAPYADELTRHSERIYQAGINFDKRFKRPFIIGGILLTFGGCVAIPGLGLGTPFIVGIFLLILYFVLRAWTVNKQDPKGFVQEYKQKVISPLLGYIDSEWDYQASEHLDDRTVYESQFFQDFETIQVSGDDRVEGKYRGADLTFSEIKASRSRKSKGSSGNSVLFQGLLYKWEPGWNWEEEIIILPKKDPDASFSGIKLFRKKGQSMQELRAHNLKMIQGMMAYTGWKPEKAENKAIQPVSLPPELDAHYLLYSTSPQKALVFIEHSGIAEYLMQFRQKQIDPNKLPEAYVSTLDAEALNEHAQTQVMLSIRNRNVYFLNGGVEKFEPIPGHAVDLADVQRHYIDVAWALGLFDALSRNLGNV